MGYVASSTVDVGDDAPDFSLQAVEGETIARRDLEGAPVVLVFLRGFY